MPLTTLLPTKAGVLACWAVCVIPLLFGFFIPVGVLLGLVATNDLLADFLAIGGIIGNTLIVAAIVAVVIMV